MIIKTLTVVKGDIKHAEVCEFADDNSVYHVDIGDIQLLIRVGTVAYVHESSFFRVPLILNHIACDKTKISNYAKKLMSNRHTYRFKINIVISAFTEPELAKLRQFLYDLASSLEAEIFKQMLGES